MASLNIVLLPGLDGTGHLFQFFLPALPPSLRPIVVSYSNQLFFDYDDLQNYVTGIMPRTERFVLLAESFSGPLALKIAASAPKNLIAVVLVATFVKNPLSQAASRFFSALGMLLFRLPRSRKFIRKYLFNKDASENLVDTFLNTLQTVTPEILAHRLRLIKNVDVRQTLLRCSVPILYLHPAKDKIVTKNSVGEILKLRPEVKIISIDAPHMLLQCEPFIASEAISDFLGQAIAPEVDCVCKIVC